MKQVLARKYNVAWFKLAECIARREKERALGVYRLLSHSFENQALVHQLEGDIMLAFNNHEAAIGKYMQAATLYEQQEEHMQAIAVYDHMLMLAYHADIVKKMIALYSAVSDHQCMMYSIKQLCLAQLKSQENDQFFAFLQTVQITHMQKAKLCVDVTLIALEEDAIDRQMAIQLVKHTLELLMYDHALLQQFLVNMRAIDESMYHYACGHIQGEVS